MDHETIDAGAANVGEALRAMARLREALQTLPFFGSGKAIWFQGCSFLGDERVAAAAPVVEAVAGLAELLADFEWRGVRLVVSSGKVDKRRTFYRTMEKIGRVEEQASLSFEMRDWAERAADHLRQHLKSLGKEISEEVLGQLVTAVGPNLAQLQSESEKVATYVGSAPEVKAEDVAAVVARNKQARAFALGDALGDRNLARVVRCLDEELWQLETDRDRSEIGIVYGLVGKVRAMLFAKELLQAGRIRMDRDYTRFRAELERMPADGFPADRKFSPLGINPYVLFRAAQQSRNYQTAELVRAMERLLRCQIELITSSGESTLVLQRAVMDICRS
jgi:DNA polymerase-3 subunit delta